MARLSLDCIVGEKPLHAVHFGRAATTALSIKRNGGLHAGLSVVQAADYIEVLTAPEMLVTMPRDRRWSSGRME